MKKIRIGQIGIGHNHASENMAALRHLSDFYEVVGVVEPDETWWERRGGFAAYQGIPRLTEEELFRTPGLEAVAVETDGFELVETARRCVDHNLHVHMDKPGGEEMEPFRALVDRFVFCGARELTSEYKHSLCNILNERVAINGESCTVLSAISIYCKSIFEALDTRNAAKIKCYEL